MFFCWGGRRNVVRPFFLKKFVVPLCAAAHCSHNSSINKNMRNYFEEIKNGYSLGNVPKKHRTPELCVFAAKKGWNIRYVPIKYRTFDLCLDAVKRDGYLLKFVPKEHRTFELCFEAVKQYGEALKFVPIKHRTFELCLEATKKWAWAMEFVPKRIRNSDRWHNRDGLKVLRQLID